MNTVGRLVATALLVAQPLLAADSRWFGTWKLNRNKSTMTGLTTTVVKHGNVYHYAFGPMQYDLAEDGKDHATIADHTARLESTGRDEWLRVDKLKGVEVSRSKITLSGDGQTLTTSKTGTHPDGSTYRSDWKQVRGGGGSGLAGTWKDVTDNSSESETVICSDAGAGKWKLKFVENKSELVAGLDGVPASPSKPQVAPGESWSFHEVSPTEVRYTISVQGKPFVEGVETLSADGTVFQDVSWLASQPAEKATEIFEKQ